MVIVLFADSAFAASLLKLESRGNDVKAMQQKLIELGYLDGKADGIFGPLTRDAVIRFQQAKGLAADGIAGPNTLNVLYGTNSSSNNQPSGKSPSTGTQPSNSIPTRLLKLGSRGEDVKQLQNRLNQLGFSCGAADGIFGNATRTAVINFQRANGLAADGIAGPATLGKLFGSTPPKNQNPPAENPSGGNPPSSESPRGGVPITQTLKRGSRGEQVKILQNRLNELGYSVGTVDGIFGAQTQNAVIAFQRDNGLAADGIVGPKTIEKLYANASPIQPGKPDSPEEDEKEQEEQEEFHGIPGQLTGKTIILDPGHGGWDVGANRDGVYEKSLNLDMAKRLKRMLEEAGATVVMTRTSDQYYSLYYRAAFANKYILDSELSKKLEEKESMEEEYDKKTEQKLKMEAEKLEKLARVDELQKLLVEKKAQESQILSQVNALSNKKLSLEQDWKIKKARYDQKTAEQQQVLQELDRLNGELSDLNEEKSRLEGELQKLIEQKKQLKEPNEEIEANIANIEAEINNIAAQISIIEGNISTIQSRLVSINDELQRLESITNQASEALEAAQEELTAKETELDRIREDIISMEEELPAIRNDITQLEEDIPALEQELLLLDIEIQEAEAEAEGIRSKGKLFKTYLNNPGLNSRQGIYEVNYDSDKGKNYINEELEEIFELARTYYQEDIIFISIHCNSTAEDVTSASGIQVYYRDNGPSSSWGTYGVNSEYYKNYNAQKREELARALLKHTTENAGFSGSYSSPYKQDFAVLRESNLVSVLMEIGFINNPNDRKLLTQEQTRENVAKGMYKGIVEYFQ